MNALLEKARDQAVAARKVTDILQALLGVYIEANAFQDVKDLQAPRFDRLTVVANGIRLRINVTADE